jgi:acetyl esterase
MNASILADGLERYVDLMRGGGSQPRSLSAQRLRGDLSAGELHWPYPSGMKTLTTFIVREGHEIAVKLYRPEAQRDGCAICYCHGGGFIFGSIESYDVVAASLADQTGATVASVQYRRLPENSYRCAQEDCHAALMWLFEHADELEVDPSRVAVAGDSVGALLATISTVMARDRGEQLPVCQLLLYGAFSMQSGRSCYASSRDPLLTPQRIDTFISAYHRHNEAGFYPPPLALDDLTGLPPAIIVAAEHDPLREEALEYADRLRASGVNVDVWVAPGMIHGFLRAMRMSSAVREQMSRVAATVREYLRANTASIARATA